MPTPNRLSQEKSPYLLQHQYNPVNWYPWGDEAFEAARREQKPIFLSIGYSTCHWCHVMEHDSFERDDVAAVLNQHFISIKLDREERPDVDQIYMDVVMAMTGHGGWPMSVFLTPELKPFFGGTFFWRDQFISLLERIHTLWQTERSRIIHSSDDVVRQLTTQTPSQPAAASSTDEHAVLTSAVDHFTRIFDPTFGGFGRAPKFPKSVDISLLLRLYDRTSDPHPLHMAELTLDKMARGGLYDHLGGGFHRYSTDEQWLVPHFEKMLYDNALLAVSYLEAYQVTGKPLYGSVAKETLDYVLRDITAPTGGFYSAEDADSPKAPGEKAEEGLFYVWTEAELREHLTSEEFDLFALVYGITPTGNFEHSTTILSLQDDYEWAVKSYPLMESTHTKLRAIREKRPKPHKDDKILTAWNGLMIAAMAKGYQVLGDSRYLNAAIAAAQFIETHLTREQKLLRRHRDGDSHYNGYLEDYAFFIHGLLTLYEASFELKWLHWAMTLAKLQDELFLDEESGTYFFSDKSATDLFMRKKETHDGATPSSNSISALNFLKLYHLTFYSHYRDRADAILKALGGEATAHPTAYAQLLIALDFNLGPATEIAVVGDTNAPETKDLLHFLHHSFLPRAVIAVDNPNLPNLHPLPALLKDRPPLHNRTTAYLCRDNTCQLPMTEIEEIKRALKK